MNAHAVVLVALVVLAVLACYAESFYVARHYRHSWKALHDWVEKRTGWAFRSARSPDSDYLLWFRLGNGGGRRGLVEFEAGIGRRMFFAGRWR